MDRDKCPDDRQDGDDPFELQPFQVGFDSNLLTSPPSLVYRPGYQRISSLGDVNTEYLGAASPDNNNNDETEDTFCGSGLAITDIGALHSPTIPRVLVDNSSLEGATDIPSPTSTRVGGTSSTEFVAHFDHRRKLSTTSSIHQKFQSGSETELLTPKDMESVGGSYTAPYPAFPCKSRHDVREGRGSYLAMFLLILAIYSTTFSAIWLFVAFLQPRYGLRISSAGGMSPQTASTIIAAVAKTIEMSFVTVFVAFVGQILSRRALSKMSAGISVAEMSIRSWIVQPGRIVTDWDSVRYGGATVLGMVAFIAALVSATYTTASDALVSPILKMGPVQNRVIYGQVVTSWANPFYVQDQCQTPITQEEDTMYGKSTCIAIEHAGQAYSNYMAYLSAWTNYIASGNGSSDILLRPSPTATLYGNTSVIGSWISPSNMTQLSEKYGRIVNNVSMAMPHSGVLAAARDPINQIMQPQDLNGLGEYYLGASVPSPVVNVLCAEVSEQDLAPLVYTEWPNATFNPLNASTWPDDYGIPASPSWINSTSVDDLFGFGEKYGRIPPVFPKFPTPYNTILNDTGYYADAIYILAGLPTPGNYSLCSLSGSLTPDCSTTYHGSLSSGSLTSKCNDSQDYLAYKKSVPDATNGIRSKDWVNVATSWALSLSLNAGITEGDASNARLLTQLVPTTSTLDQTLPSIAEALAILAGCTLLISSIDSPFVQFWNYSATDDILSEPQIQSFNGSLQYQDYASGGNYHYQGIFYMVLLLVFITNVCCLAHFIIRGDLVTDFTEPRNLFALSLNSAPSETLAGSCGGGPEAQEYKAKWSVVCDNGHFSIESRNTPITKPGLLTQETIDSNRAKNYFRLSTNKYSWL